MVEMTQCLSLPQSQPSTSTSTRDDPVPKPAPELKPLELTDPGSWTWSWTDPISHRPLTHKHIIRHQLTFTLAPKQMDFPCKITKMIVQQRHIYMHQEGGLAIVSAAFQLPPCLFKLPLGFDFSNLSCHLPPWATASLLLLLPITQRVLHPLASTHLSSPRSIHVVLRFQ